VLPSVLMAIVIVAIVGPSFRNTILAIGIVSLPAVYRIVRGAVMLEMSKNYVQASKSFGASWWRVTFINVLPNCWAPLIVQASLGFSEAILSAAALGFLGLGAQPPTPEWGTMLSDARSYMESSPWLVTFPGLCILFVVMGFNFIGDGLRDWMDPKLRRTM
jgi:ABC-type dipeptide/oligopeptide/nickel transport system permease subunit